MGITLLCQANLFCSLTYFFFKDLFGFFFRRLQTLSKVKLTERMNELITQSKGHTRLYILRVDIVNISTNVKQLDLIELCEGKMLFQQAKEAILSRTNREQGMS